MSTQKTQKPTGWGWWKKSDEKPSCDKGSHKERSKANQPNHNKHWKKVEKKEKQNGQ